MLDIGIVYYRLGEIRDTIDAIWYTTRLGKRQSGRGTATGDTAYGFPGKYVITYFYPDGGDAGTFDLEIQKSGPVYDLSWSQKGKLTHVGVGLDVPGGLAAGWRKIDSVSEPVR